MRNNDSSFTGISAQNISSPKADFCLFHHQDLLTAPDSEKPWDQKKLVNKLNHLNFIDGFIYLILSDNNGKYFLSKAHPLPCVKDELNCRLTSSEVTNNISKYKFDFLMIDDGLTAILAPIQLISFENDIIKLSLPEHSHVKKLRKTRRHKCDDVDCRLTQDNLEAKGKLIDFTPTAMGVRLSVNDSAASFDFNNPVELSLSKKGNALYSSPCSCIRDSINAPDGKIIFKPLITQMERFPKRKMRNPRQIITPSFSINFKHPLFDTNVEKDILEISTSGFSVCENIEYETILPGMIIHKMLISYAGILDMECSVQVLYRHIDVDTVKFGFAIINMDIKPYSQLNHILGIHLDNRSRVSSQVDMDDLWDFFFDTGFIYSEKYQYLYSYRDIFKETYNKLYQNNPDIARHFIYKENGTIYGHISMIHAYNPSWLIHHFAARPFKNRISGLSVLKQIIHYINGFYRFSSGGMDYVMAYFQPDNDAMNLIFGGFVDFLNNSKGSSLDTFSYLTFDKNFSKDNLPSDFALNECNLSDLDVLINFYQNYSGGILIDAMGLSTPMTQLRESFNLAGFTRNCQIFCLKSKNKHVAFFIVNKSNLGMNFSDLLNSITVFIINDSLKWKIISAAIRKLDFYYKENIIPLLFYPSSYLKNQHINANKYYHLWVIKNNPHVEQYAEYMSSRFRMKYR